MSGPTRSLTIQWHDPLATARGANGRTGLAFLRAIIAGEVPPAPMQSTMGFALISADDGLVRFRLESPGEHLYNPMNSVHGGVAATLLDSAMGSAVMSTLDENTAYTTCDFTVHLTRAMTTRTGPAIAEGRVLHRGKRIVTALGRLTDADGRVLAHGSTTCLLLERPAG